MIALAAAVVLVLAAFGVTIGGVDLVVLGLALWALHFAWDRYPWR